MAALQRYGIAASAPMFVPGFGAFVRMHQYPSNAREEAEVGLAGPLWGLGAALFAYLLARLFGVRGALPVASLAAVINLFNLLPVWQLDGARGLGVLSRSARGSLAALAGVVALVTQQWMPAVVGAGLAFRAVRGEAPATSDGRLLARWALLLVSLGALAAAR